MGNEPSSESSTDPDSIPETDTEAAASNSHDTDSSSPPNDRSPAGDTEELSTDALRERVEAEYDFDAFGPADMADMTGDEWEAVFDPETWITGTALLDRVERELRANVHRREVFAVVERVGDGDADRVVAYSDEGYVVVRPDGSIQGTGTILRDVEPMIALCAIEDYDVPDVPDDAGLPHPDTVPEGSGDLGNKLLQVVGGVTVLAGFGLIIAWIASILDIVDLGFAGAIVVTLGLIFLFLGGFLFITVANARLSDKLRAEQYRARLRMVGAGSDERPDFLPDEAFEKGGREIEQALARIHQEATASLGDDSGDEQQRPG